MDVHSYIEIISGKRRGLAGSVLRAALKLLSVPYAAVTRVRNFAFQCGLKKVHQVSVPVIAIGNLTTGGTGKTPVVAAVVQMLQQAGRTPGIVSRGYHADASGENDEKRVLAVLCPNVPHQQNPDRVAAANVLIEQHGVDCIVLDDAFQHRRIARDLNIVLIDATNPFGFGHQLPRGLLRESLTGLKRADLALITRSDSVSVDERNSIKSEVIRHNAALSDRIASVCFQPTELLGHGNRQQSLESISGQPVAVMTAIGNPTAFVETCERLSAEIVTTRFFPDHHHFTDDELQQVQDEAKQNGATRVLTTMKDLVKIPSRFDDFLAVQISTVFDSSDAENIVRVQLAAVIQV